jgi:quinoprotein glucose dehydrogenase
MSLSKLWLFAGTLGFICLSPAFVSPLFAQNDWPGYGKDAFGQRHSPLAQINTGNVKKLKPAWQYGIDPKAVSMDNATRLLTSTEAVPIMVGGILYSPTMKRTIVALEPETGKEIWKYELGNVGAPLRGVSYWAGDQDHPASILAGTNDGKLIELNAKTGKLVPGFGNEGAVNLKQGVEDRFPDAPYHMASPGAI